MIDVLHRGKAAVRRVRHAAWSADKRLRYGRYRIRSSENPRFRRAVSTSAVITIDVFDTAVFRCVPKPVDVFEIAGFRMREAGLSHLDPIDYRNRRTIAERTARHEAARAGREEVTIDEIFAVLAREILDLDTAAAIAEELSVERAVCFVNPDIKRFYDVALAEGRVIAFVSDAYFPQSHVAEVLASCGYGGNHELFVSSAFCATKDHGTLFPLVAEHLGVELQRIVHIGDNLRADVQSAQRCGITAFWYGRRVLERRHGGTTIGDRILDRLAGLTATTGSASAEERILRDVSYGVLGPIFLGLMQWLVEGISAGPADRVLFCARDGHFLHQIYERFAALRALPPAQYFEVSRRSLAFPSITVLDKRALDILCSNHAALELSEFFTRIGIDVTAFPDQLAAAGLRADSMISDAGTREQLRTLFVSLSDAVLERVRTERTLTIDYLRQSGVFDARDIVLVDIGWGGTLQQALARLLASEGEPRAIRAFYLSTDDRILALGADDGSARAWFTNASEPAWMQEQMIPGYWLLEIAFAAQHGTVLGYARDADGRIGALHHTYDDGSANARAARAIHHHSSELIDRWIRIFNGVGPSLPMASTFARFQRFSQRPTMGEARFFGDMVHVGGLGSTAERRAVAAPPHIAEITRRPRAFLDGYRESPWEIAFLQRLFASNAIARAVLAVRGAVRGSRDRLKAQAQRLRRPGAPQSSAQEAG